MPGLLAAVRWLQQIAHDAKAEPSGVAESWVGVDASDGGHGAVLASPPDWLAQGVLVALRGEASQVCRVGLIRRISSDGFGQHRVGVELLGDGALPVALFEIGNRKADDLEQAGEPAILVSRRPDAEGMIELMYRPQSFQRSKKLQIRFRERVMRIEFVASVVRDADHHWARFRVVYD